MNLCILTDIQANGELYWLQVVELWWLSIPTRLGDTQKHKSTFGRPISGIVCSRNEYLNENNRNEVNNRSKQNTNTIVVVLNKKHNNIIIMKQGNKVRNHSLNFIRLSNNKIWIVLFLRGKPVRNYRNSNVIRRLDSTKIQYNNILRSNTTLVNYQKLGNDSLNLKRYYSTSSDVIERLEKSKRDLEIIIIPKLKQNVIDYKNNSKTVWILDNHNSESSTIKLGIKIYISICTFLIALKTSIAFTRYLNIEIKSTEIINPDLKNDLPNSIFNPTLHYIENINKEFKLLSIESDYPEKYNNRNRFSNVYRDKLADSDKWRVILEDSKNNLESIIFKYWAVELIEKTNGAKTAGIDGMAFKSKNKLFKSGQVKDAKKYLATKYKNFAKIVSIFKGNNAQSINRKGRNNLNENEKLRNYLKSKQGREYILFIKTELRSIRNSPVEYANKIYWNVHEHNNNLKFALCSYIRNSKLKNYKSKNILRVYIPKTNGKLRALGIPTIYDRCLQTLLKLVMEPYMEPLGDEYSFGFRPGRNCHQATACIHHRLLHYRSNKLLTLKERAYLDKKMESIYLKDTNSKGKVDLSKIDPNNNIKVTISGFGKVVRSKQIMVPSWLYERATQKSEKIMYDTQFVIDADIKGCFDNISHEWLINNVPMPTSYENLLPKILKTTILEEDDNQNPFSNYSFKVLRKSYKVVVEKENNLTGIPQGGIISPLLMNWTLDGLQHFVKISAHKLGAKHNLYSVDRANYLKEKDIKNFKPIQKNTVYINKARIEWYNTTWIVRYADDFLIGVKSQYMAELLKEEISKFLSPRGLALSDEKTHIVPWKIGNHIDFLGWTHSLIKPNKVNWLINTSKHKAGKILDWIGTYTYPSRKSTKKFRENIKNITSNKFNYLPPVDIIKWINSQIRGWSNYFSPAPYQIHLRRHLDVYIWRRTRKYIMNKFQHSFHDRFIQHFSREVDRKAKGAFYHKKSNTYRIWLQSLSISNSNLDKGTMRQSSIDILNLTKLNIVSMWSYLTPTTELIHNSPMVNKAPFIKRALLIAKYRKDSHSLLSFKQEHKCTICCRDLIHFNALIHSKLDNYIDNLNENNSIIPKDLNTNNLENATETNKPSSIYWLANVEIDHIIPKIIAGNSHALIKIVNSIPNLQLLHKNCHSYKTETDRVFLDNYRIIKKNKLPNALTSYKEIEISKATFEIILEMNALNYFGEFNKKIVAQLVKESKKQIKLFI
jgi:retron-type reverse transcriptase